jgi:hypothetical protein
MEGVISSKLLSTLFSLTTSSPHQIIELQKVIFRPFDTGRLHALFLESGGYRSTGSGKDHGHFGLRERQKALHYGGIKLRAARLDQPAYRFFGRKAVAVRSRGDHGVKRVYDGDDPRYDGDFSLLQTGRVALSVIIFMVMENVERRPFETGKNA